MAAFTITDNRTFPEGTVVGAYAFDGDTPGRVSGPRLGQATMNGSVTFNLPEGTEYWAVNEADHQRRLRFFVPPRPSSPFVLKAEQWLNVRDFGAVGDGVTDDSPAFQAAFNAMTFANGGTLFVPPGIYLIENYVFLHGLDGYGRGFPQLVNIIGCGGASTLKIAVGPAAEYAPNVPGYLLDLDPIPTNWDGLGNIGLEFANMEKLTIQGLAFTGTPDINVTDAGVVLALSGVELEIRDCFFYGLATEMTYGDRSINYWDNPTTIHCAEGDLLIKGCVFRGMGSLGADGSVVRKGSTASSSAPVGGSLQIFHSAFLDPISGGIGVEKATNHHPTSWVRVGGGAGEAGANSAAKLRFDNVYLDEAAYTSILVAPEVEAPPYDWQWVAPWGRIELNNVKSNNGVGGAKRGLHVVGAKLVRVFDATFGWSGTPAGEALRFEDVDRIELDSVSADYAADELTADASCGVLEINNSVIPTITSSATIMRIDGHGVQTLASAATIAPSVDADLVNVTGTTNITTVTATKAGHVLTLKFAAGLVLGGANLKLNRVTQYVTVNATGGQFKLTYAGQTTADIAYNATAGTVQTALEALSTIDPGDIVVTGGPGGSGGTTPYLVTFIGRYAAAALPITGANGTTPLSGGGASISVIPVFLPTADDTSTLVCDGTNWIEVARSPN